MKHSKYIFYCRNHILGNQLGAPQRGNILGYQLEAPPRGNILGNQLGARFARPSWKKGVRGMYPPLLIREPYVLQAKSFEIK